MDIITEYEAITLAWAACPNAHPATIGRALVGLALALKSAAGRHDWIDELDERLNANRDRVALQLMILASEARGIADEFHQRDFAQRVRAIVHAMRESGNRANFVGSHEPELRMAV